MPMKLKDSIIIHGPGRSGTTLLDGMLSMHEELFWISSYLNKFPRQPFLSVLNRMQQSKLLQRNFKQSSYFPRPNEAYHFWRTYFTNFNLGNEVEVHPEELERCLKALNQIKQYSSGKRFVTKFTGSSRMPFIQAMFDRPTIVWIDRKPQAVIMSYYKQKWGYKNRLADFKAKPKMKLLEEYVVRYEKVFKEKELLQQLNFVQVFYEDLVANPIQFYEGLCQRLNLPFSKRFKEQIDQWEVQQGTNYSYRKLLDEEESNWLDSRCAVFNERLGYSS